MFGLLKNSHLLDWIAIFLRISSVILVYFWISTSIHSYGLGILYGMIFISLYIFSEQRLVLSHLLKKGMSLNLFILLGDLLLNLSLIWLISNLVFAEFLILNSCILIATSLFSTLGAFIHMRKKKEVDVHMELDVVTRAINKDTWR